MFCQKTSKKGFFINVQKIKKEGVKMGVDSVNSNKTVDIFYNPKLLGGRGLNIAFHERENGKMIKMGDGNIKKPEDALKCAQRYLDDGYPIENIRINGQPITDKFQRNKNGKYEPVVRHAGDTFEKKPSTMKKIGTGAASAVIPGAGQVINGDYKKAGWIVAGNILLPRDSYLRDALRWYSAYDAYKNADKSAEKEPEKAQKEDYKAAG